MGSIFLTVGLGTFWKKNVSPFCPLMVTLKFLIIVRLHRLHLYKHRIQSLKSLPLLSKTVP